MRRILAAAAATLMVLVLASCGAASQDTSAVLIRTYYNIGEQDKDSVSVLNTESWQDGSLACALYTGSGSHLVLFSIAKDKDGKESITAVCEGRTADTFACSVNIVADNGKTIVFGEYQTNEKGEPAFNGIRFTFDNGAEAAAKPGGRGYVIVADGELKIKGFTLTAPGKDDTGGYQDFLKAGGSITRTAFMPVNSK